MPAIDGDDEEIEDGDAWLEEVAAAEVVLTTGDASTCSL